MIGTKMTWEQNGVKYQGRVALAAERHTREGREMIIQLVRVEQLPTITMHSSARSQERSP